MNTYLTIGEFAKLRNVDRKSVRYYEKIGALLPAYTDPKTKYRYYSLEQLVDLDTILMCLELGIPLKNAVEYKNDDGTLNILRLYHDGKEKINEKFMRLNITMKRLESSIQAIEESKKYQNQETFYQRYINKRYILRTPLKKLDDEIFFKNQAKDLFIKAETNGLVPIYNFPIGLMIERQKDQLNIYITVELMPYHIDFPEVLTLPEGTYVCYQDHSAHIYNPSSYCIDMILSNANIDMVTITNITLEEYKNGIFPLEIQAFMNNPNF